MSNNTNFATWNGAAKPAYTNFEHGNTKSDGNTGADAAGANSSMAMNSGKWYAEFYLTINTTYPMVGLSPGASAGDNRPFHQNSGYLSPMRYKPGASAGSRLEDNTAIFSPNGFGTITRTQTNVDTASTGDIIGFALDVDNKKLWISKNGTFFNSGDPAAGSNEQYSWATNPQDIFFQCTVYTGGRAVHANFGQDSTFAGNTSAGSNTDGNGYGEFKYSVPTGFLALCSANLPVSDDIDPAQTDDDYPAKNFNTVLYTGNGSDNHAITGLGFQPDIVWIQRRSGGTSYGNGILDSTRGAGLGLYPDRTDADTTFTSDFDSFDSDGFTVDAGSSMNINNSSSPFVAHCWKVNGGTTSTNNEGNHTCTLQANAKAGCSIMTLANYTSASGVTIGHGLDKAPSFYFHKSRANTGNWHVYHSFLGATKALLLNEANAAATAIGYWANTEPTADVLSLGNTFAGTFNGIVYAWAEVDGYSKFGAYEGNADTNGIFVYTGFRPRMLFVKDVDRTENWQIFDTARNTFNPVDTGISWNDSAAESTGSGSGFDVDFLSNGFKMRCAHDNLNGSSTYVYGAWGDVPAKYNNTF